MTKEDVPSLPEISSKSSNSPIDKGRFCPDCGKEGRVVSNYLGVNVHCNHCKTSWAISGPVVHYETAAAMPRGFQKRTLVEPDTSIAYSTTDEEDKR